jgi:hypothetical protein
MHFLQELEQIKNNRRQSADQSRAIEDKKLREWCFLQTLHEIHCMSLENTSSITSLQPHLLSQSLLVLLIAANSIHQEPPLVLGYALGITVVRIRQETDTP